MSATDERVRAHFDHKVARSHAALWSVIDIIAAENGFSPSGLAIEIGMDPTSFNKSKRVTGAKLHWPASATIARILAVTNISFAEFGRMVDHASFIAPAPTPVQQGAAA